MQAERNSVFYRLKWTIETTIMKDIIIAAANRQNYNFLATRCYPTCFHLRLRDSDPSHHVISNGDCKICLPQTFSQTGFTATGSKQDVLCENVTAIIS